jgi:hypothetical protein
MLWTVTPEMVLTHVDLPHYNCASCLFVFGVIPEADSFSGAKDKTNL